MVSRCLAKEYLKNIKTKVFGKLEDQGAFREVLEQDLYNYYLPWTFGQLVEVLGDKDQVRELLNEMNKNLVDYWSSVHKETINKEKDRRQAVMDEEKRKKKEKEERKRLREERKKKEEFEKMIADIKGLYVSIFLLL